MAVEWVAVEKSRRAATVTRRRTFCQTVYCRSPKRRAASVKLPACATVTKLVNRVGSNKARSLCFVMTITSAIGLHNNLGCRHLEDRHSAAGPINEHAFSLPSG